MIIQLFLGVLLLSYINSALSDGLADDIKVGVASDFIFKDGENDMSAALSGIYLPDNRKTTGNAYPMGFRFYSSDLGYRFREKTPYIKIGYGVQVFLFRGQFGIFQKIGKNNGTAVFPELSVLLPFKLPTNKDVGYSALLLNIAFGSNLYLINSSNDYFEPYLKFNIGYTAF